MSKSSFSKRIWSFVVKPGEEMSDRQKADRFKNSPDKRLTGEKGSVSTNTVEVREVSELGHRDI